MSHNHTTPLPAEPAAAPLHNPSILSIMLPWSAGYLLVGQAWALFPEAGNHFLLGWPAGGVATAAILLHGPRLWPGIALGALLLTGSLGMPFFQMVAIAIGQTLQSLLAWHLLMRRSHAFNPMMDHITGVIQFTVFAVGLSAGVYSVLAVTGACLAGVVPWIDFLPMWFLWWIGAGMGILLLAPLLLTFPQWRVEHALAGKRGVEGLLLLLLLVPVTVLTHTGLFGIEAAPPLAYLGFPFVIWAGGHFRQHGASTAAVLICAIALWGIVHGHGPFVRPTLIPGIIDLYAFLCAMTVVGLMLAATVAERERSRCAYLATLEGLENKVRERTSELHLAKEAAEEGSRAKSSFLANMSHEIRTPMNAIVGLTELALRADPEPRQKDYLTKIRAASYSLLGIINDILDYSKIEVGKLTLEATEFDLNEVLDNLRNLLESRLVEKQQVELILSKDPRLPALLVGDPLRLGQILLNLAGNAVKFTERGEIEVRATLVEEGADAVLADFTVRDTGIGITPAQLEKLFDSFSQADESTTRKYGGTGLGLAICKRLVALMQGEIRVTSEPGAGSVFSFRVPLGRRAPIQEERLIASRDLRGMPVLVVDDNDTSREILSEIMTSFSFTVATAKSGSEAVAEWRRALDAGNPHGVVLMDWRMPDLDGMQAAAAIRREWRERYAEDKAAPGAPKIILLTAFGREEWLNNRHKSEVDACLLKPVNPSLLFETIMDLFGQRVIHKAQRVEQADPMADAVTLRGARILLVEDNAINQQVAREILEGAGLVVRIAENGRKAVQAVAETRFDAVLMDVQMPVMDGYDATREIRRDPAHARLPIVAMTAHAMQGSREKCLEAGMNDHVTKPIDLAQLFSVLGKWILAPVSAPLATAHEAVPFPEVPGVQVRIALNRLGGNAGLLLDLLIRFRKDYIDRLPEIRRLLAGEGEEKELLALAHTIKGVAGNLAAEELRVAAVDLEAVLRNPDATASAEPGERFERALTDLMEAIRPLEERNAPAVAAVPMILGDAREALREMRTLIGAASMEVDGSLAKLRGMLAGSEHEPALNDLAGCIDRFDFNGAAIAWQRLAAPILGSEATGEPS
ncbi:MAG: response regulator [Magnetococcales bacterium]|nr:response regulator [Magnetococcales bacterium]